MTADQSVIRTGRLGTDPTGGVSATSKLAEHHATDQIHPNWALRARIHCHALIQQALKEPVIGGDVFIAPEVRHSRYRHQSWQCYVAPDEPQAFSAECVASLAINPAQASLI